MYSRFCRAWHGAAKSSTSSFSIRRLSRARTAARRFRSRRFRSAAPGRARSGGTRRQDPAFDQLRHAERTRPGSDGALLLQNNAACGQFSREPRLPDFPPGKRREHNLDDIALAIIEDAQSSPHHPNKVTWTKQLTSHCGRACAYTKDQFADVLQQTEDYVRENRRQSLLYRCSPVSFSIDCRSAAFSAAWFACSC